MFSPDKTNWSFEPHPNDSWDGWNDFGTPEFRENPLQALAREIIQNSMDAQRGEDDVVQVRFQERMMPRASIPNIGILTDVLDKCLEAEEELDGEDWIKEEIRTAIKDASHPKGIRVLSISDTGTKGMRGPCTRGTHFYRYLKTKYQPGGDASKTGSHGIGKMAPLCNSSMRSILVSTLWEEKGELCRLIAGRANLSSHMNGGKTYAGVGYWGEEGKPIEPKDCPKEKEYDWLRRKEEEGTGTTIHVLGWSPTEKEWGDIVLAYVAINFFAALQKGRLEVCIDDLENGKEKILNKESIGDFFEDKDKRVRGAMKKPSLVKKFKDSQFFHKCMADDTDKELKSDSRELKHLGDCELRMRVESGAPRRIAIIRNDMLITTHFDGFGLAVLKDYQECGGVFECKDDDGNTLLRSMEPPAHNKLKLGKRHSRQAEADERNALRALARYLKDMAEEFVGVKVPSGSEIGIMAKYLSDDDGSVDIDIDTPIDPDCGLLIPPKLTAARPLGEYGKGKKKHRNAGSKKRAKQPKQVLLQKRRVIFKKGEKAVRVFITPAETQEADLHLYEVGAIYKKKKDKIMIMNASGSMERKLSISLRAGKSIALDLSLSRKIAGGVDVAVEARSKKITNKGDV